MDPTHSRFGEYFLGHSGGNVRARHHLDMKQLQPQFDAAVAFIGQELLKGWQADVEQPQQDGPSEERHSRAG
jgi:hypothetical protein